jgi:hypothetical protein
MDVERIKLEARLFASEYLLCNLYAMIFRAAPDPGAAVAAFGAELRSNMEGFAVAGLDPVQSDSFAGEVREALDLLLGQLGRMMPPPKEPDGSSSQG